MSDITIIGVPVDLGAGRRGVDMGPSAIRYAGLRERLTALGHQVHDSGNITVPLAEAIAAPAAGERLRYLEPLIDVNTMLARHVAEVMARGGIPLVLGGDHSLSIGSVAGAAYNRQIGLIWIDAHGDFNTADTTPSGNIHGMGLAALVGRGHPALTSVLAAAPALHERNVALVGVRDLDAEERLQLRASGLHIYTMNDIDRRGMAVVMEEAIHQVSSARDGYYVSFDLDALDPTEAPGVGTPVIGGIAYREAQLAMEMIADTRRLIGLDLVEVNPILDIRNATAILAIEFALSAFGKRIL